MNSSARAATRFNADSLLFRALWAITVAAVTFCVVYVKNLGDRVAKLERELFGASALGREAQRVVSAAAIMPFWGSASLPQTTGARDGGESRVSKLEERCRALEAEIINLHGKFANLTVPNLRVTESITVGVADGPTVKLIGSEITMKRAGSWARLDASCLALSSAAYVELMAGPTERHRGSDYGLWIEKTSHSQGFCGINNFDTSPSVGGMQQR